MESRSSKRKRCGDVKNALVDGLHNLTLISFQLNEDLQAANDDFLLMFKSMGDRESELYAGSIALDEKYGELIGMLQGQNVLHVGESSSQSTNLPSSYSMDKKKFIDDTSSSLNGHSKAFLEKVDHMLKEIEEQSAIWKSKVIEMKKQAERIVSQRRNLAVQLNDFKKEI